MKGKEFPKIDFSKLSLPPVELKIVRRNGVYKVFDILRKNYYVLTEEEFIRQIFVNWMIKEMGYPASIMSNEIGIRLNDTYKRCDTVVFNPEGNPWMIVEYKAPGVKIDQEVFNQIVRYNMCLRATYMIVSNGNQTFCCRVDYNQHSIEFMAKIPKYEEIKENKNGDTGKL